MLVRQRASALVARVFGSCMHLKHPSTVDVHPVVLKKIDFDITTEDIEKFDNNVENLQKFNGVPGVLCALKVDPSKGIDASEEDLKSRQDAFGSNTYPIKQNKPFWMFVWEALQDETLIILMACAAVALIIGFTTMDPAKGWYDGGGIAFAIVLVVLVSSTSNYKQSLQFQELNAEKRKIHINVTRQGRRKKILIFDLLVGDIVHLGIGDQVVCFVFLQVI